MNWIKTLLTMSLRTEIDKYSIFNSIAMDQSLTSYFLIVEGATDAGLFSNFTDENTCNIIFLNSRENVITIMSDLEKARKNVNAFAIIDKDQESIFPTIGKLPDHTFFTDTNDIETMIFFSDTFCKVAKELFPVSKCKNNQSINSIIDIVIKLALSIGELRLVDKREKLNMSFKKPKNRNELDFKKFIQQKDMSYKGDEKMIEAIKGHSLKPQINTEFVKQALLALRSEKYSDHDIIVGHDVTRIIALALKQAYSKDATKNFTNEQVELSFRLAYSKDDFLKTKLATDIRNAKGRLKCNIF